MKLKRASQFTVAELATLWNLGYTDYFVPIHFTEELMANHHRTGDLDLERSLVMLDGDQPIGFSYLAVRGDRGWIGGVGMAPAYRGKGLATSLFAEHTDLIQRETDLQNVQLEVFVQNWAQKVYGKNGFATTRRLSLLQGHLEAHDSSDLIQAAEPAALLQHSERLHATWEPCWQREATHVTKAMHPEAKGIFIGQAVAPTGFLIYRIAGDSLVISDAAAGESPDEAARLVGALAQTHPGYKVMLFNEPEGSPIHRALLAAGLAETGAQLEMHWRPQEP